MVFVYGSVHVAGINIDKQHLELSCLSLQVFLLLTVLAAAAADKPLPSYRAPVGVESLEVPCR